MFDFAQSVGPGGEVGYRFADDLTLRLSELLRDPADALNGGVVERVGDLDHEVTTMP